MGSAAVSFWKDPSASGEGLVYSLGQQSGGHWQSGEETLHVQVQTTLPAARGGRDLPIRLCGYSSSVGKGMFTVGGTRDLADLEASHLLLIFLHQEFPFLVST